MEPEQTRTLAAILEADPALRDLDVTVHRSWDSDAFDFAGTWIVKAPRTTEARARLARELGFLGVLQGRVTLPIPEMTWLDPSAGFTRHRKIAGVSLTPDRYAALDDRRRDLLAETLAHFYVQLHGIPVDEMARAGAVPVPDLRTPDAEDALAALPPARQEEARTALARHDRMGPDPLGDVFGYFDGHGWNMAFDLSAGRLNGLFDFADAGIGPLHREFVPSGFVAPDLTWRIVERYERRSGKTLSRDRVWLLTLALRLSELGEKLREPPAIPGFVSNVIEWLDNPPR